MLPKHERVRVLALVLLASFGAAACSMSGDSDLDVPLPPKDIDRWVMPVDQFMPQDQAVLDYAENVLVSECMSVEGFQWTVPRVDIHAPLQETINIAHRSLFTRAIAAKWGYLPAPSTQPNAAQLEQFSATPLPAGSEDHFWQCVEDVRAEALPPVSNESRNFAASLGAAADRGARLDDAVLATAQRWRGCMEPIGISDLPRTPEEMPSPSLRLEFGRRDPDVTDALVERPVANAREIDVATSDAACRTSSGWAETRYEAEWSRQVAAVVDNADALMRILAENDAAEERAIAVLIERGLG